METIVTKKNIMANTENKGQKFVKKGSYVKKGTVIMRAEPFAAVLNSELHAERCDTCFKSCKISRCSGCKYVYYCGRDCQRKSWSVHKVECSSLRRLDPLVPPETVLLLTRIIIKCQHGGDQERGYYGSNEYRTFGDLMSHSSEISKDSKMLEKFTSLYGMMQNFLPQEILPNRHELLTIFGRININSFEILDSDNGSIGTGIYLGPSIIDHSCKPNTSRVFNGMTLVVYAMHDIPSYDWTKISISYISTLRSVDERREMLRNYYFSCNCDRCKNPDRVETAAACPNKSCTNPCFPDELECSKCGQKFPLDFGDNFEMIKTRSLRYLEKKKVLENIQTFLMEQERLLHPLNMLHVRMLEIAVPAAMELNLWKEAEIYSRKLLQKYQYYFGDVHHMTAHVCIRLSRILRENKKFEESLNIMKKYKDIIKIMLGQDWVIQG